MASWTNSTKSSAPTWNNATRTGPAATAGLVMGMLTMTYSGGQTLSGNTPWANVSKASTPSWLNVTKS